MNKKDFTIYTEEDKQVIRLFREEMDRLSLLYMEELHTDNEEKATFLLKRIQGIRNQLETMYTDRENIELGNTYLKGAEYIKLIDNHNIKLTNRKSLPNTVLEYNIGELGPINIEAINAILNNSKNIVKLNPNGMEKQIWSPVTEIQQLKIREELAKGMISGQSEYEINQRITKYFTDNGITEFKDKTGKHWDINRYIDMVIRTETSIANIQGIINRAVQLGITKFKVHESSDCCNICMKHNGKIYDIREEAELPPFHPNCRGFITTVMDI